MFKQAMTLSDPAIAAAAVASSAATPSGGAESMSPWSSPSSVGVPPAIFMFSTAADASSNGVGVPGGSVGATHSATAGVPSCALTFT